MYAISRSSTEAPFSTSEWNFISYIYYYFYPENIEENCKKMMYNISILLNTTLFLYQYVDLQVLLAHDP